MPTIRIPDEHWGKVWRALVAAGPISCVGKDPIYFISESHLRMLRRKKLPFQLISPPNGRSHSTNHAWSGPPLRRVFDVKGQRPAALWRRSIQGRPYAPAGPVRWTNRPAA